MFLHLLRHFIGLKLFLLLMWKLKKKKQHEKKRRSSVKSFLNARRVALTRQNSFTTISFSSLVEVDKEKTRKKTCTESMMGTTHWKSMQIWFRSFSSGHRSPKMGFERSNIDCFNLAQCHNAVVCVGLIVSIAWDKLLVFDSRRLVLTVIKMPPKFHHSKSVGIDELRIEVPF